MNENVKSPGFFQTPQEKFDEMYITATEICREMGVSRAGILYARKKGYLPQPISINNDQIYIWERAPLQEYLNAWRIILNTKRGVA